MSNVSDYNYEKDASRVGLKYSGCFDSYVKELISHSKFIWVCTENSYSLDFKNWAIEISKIKEAQYIKEHRKHQLDSIL